ncbi:MAG: permease prefix domain 1-containing protein [Clostridia bacterium]|nr:permease prefix domain 1-containing protein [Clostridia bacterium]
MNTIRNYINAMFSSLPKTPEILRLQAEMLENLEDRYNDLLREGKSENEAVGIILASIGSAEDLKAELGISEDEPPAQPLEDHSVFLAERAAFHRTFAIAMAFGVVLCICAVIAGAVCDSFTHNDGITSIAFFGPVAIAVAIFVYFGIREDWYNERYKEIQQPLFEPEPKSEKMTLSSVVASILFPLAVILYLCIGFLYGLWHPGWIIFPFCAIIVGAVDSYDKYRKQ